MSSWMGWSGRVQSCKVCSPLGKIVSNPTAQWAHEAFRPCIQQISNVRACAPGIEQMTHLHASVSCHIL